MEIKEDKDLTQYNTFGVGATARFFSEINSLDTLKEIIKKNQVDGNEFLTLGGGSNVLFTKNTDAWVLKNELKGVRKIKEDSENVWIEAFGGEDWHSFVLYTLENGYYGLENLSLIPGSVGACPIQNIGAYGVEVKDFISDVYTIDLSNSEEEVFTNSQCDFGYRNSIFKNELKGKVFIYKVVFKLNKSPNLNVAYRALNEELEKQGINNPEPIDISKAVIAVRSSKLPDPKEIGNSGSFFKNPEITKEIFEKLKLNFPDIPNYPGANGLIKLAAGWLIDKAGWKGYRDGDVGVHKKQALVLVNYGKGSGKEVYDLSERIILDIKNKFGITLAREVNVI